MLLRLLETLEKAVAFDDPEPPKMMDPGGDFRTGQTYADTPKIIPPRDTDKPKPWDDGDWFANLFKYDDDDDKEPELRAKPDA